MKNKNVKEMFDTKYNQAKNYDAIISKIKKSEHDMMKILKLVLAPVCLLILVGLVFFTGNKNNIQDTKLSDYLAINVYTSKSNDNYYLTSNYLEETNRISLNQDVRVLLAKYNKAVSSVPGIPIDFNINKNIFSGKIDSVKINIANGEILNLEESIVTSLGSEYVLTISKTLYFSPSNNSNINIIGTKNGEIIFSKEIEITVDGAYNYYVTLKDDTSSAR